MHGVNLRTNASVLPPSVFLSRRARITEQFKDGTFLADPDAKGKPKPNPITDPNAMEGMMGAMKGNVAMMVPQTLIMGWINAFFSGFVLCTCLPIQFNEPGGSGGPLHGIPTTQERFIARIILLSSSC